MNKKNLLIVISSVLAVPAFTFAVECSPSLKASLLSDAQALEAGSRTTSAIYENNDQNIHRLRQLAVFTGTNSFAEYFERAGVKSNIYFIENDDGTYRSVHTDDSTGAVVFCDTDFQDENVTWKESSLPVIDINIVCGDDKSIIAEGVIEYFTDGLEVRGGLWKKEGVATPCAGASTLGTAVYTPL